MKQQLKKILSKYDYKLVKIKKRRVSGSDPRLLPYLNTLPYMVIDLPMSKGIGWKHYPLNGKTYHPFVVALRHYMKDTSEENRLYEVLKAQAERINCSSPNEVLGLASAEVFPENGHTQEYTLPWSGRTPVEQKAIQLKSIRRENKQYGLNSEDTLGSKPLSERKIKIETQRLISLFNSIQENGFQTDYHDALNGSVLVHGDQWKWMVNSGQHRVSVASVFGYEKVPVHVKQIVRREDVAFWPAVRKGIFKEKPALEVFDNLFNTKIPAYLKDWKQFVDENFDGGRAPYKSGPV